MFRAKISKLLASLEKYLETISWNWVSDAFLDTYVLSGLLLFLITCLHSKFTAG